MIYLTFDSNIWIYSLDDSWSLENQLDYIEFWIEEGQIKLLLPDIIKTEWTRNRDKEVKEREEKLKSFFQMAEEILPTAFFADYKDPRNQDLIIKNQLNRIEKLLENALIIEPDEHVYKKVIEYGIAKKAPLHKKSSIADAIIVFSLIHFASKNPGNQYYFISNNTDDFYNKGDKKKIHPDLENDFTKNDINYFKSLDHLNQVLKTNHNLTIGDNVELRKKERIKNKLKEKVYNPGYEKITADQETSFISNVEMMESIIKKTKPTKEQIIFVLALIDSDKAYETKFYEKLENPQWFKILKTKVVFDPSNNPPPVPNGNFWQIPRWEAMTFLLKLSEQTQQGKEHEYLDEIINIIIKISEKPKDNFRTWLQIIRILSNLPNDKISLKILAYIPVWLECKFEVSFISSEILEKLLPKFLQDEPTQEDIRKAEIILKHLFTIHETESKDSEEGYFSKVESHYLLSIIRTHLISKIATHCSDDIFIFLAANLKKLCFDFPYGLNQMIKIGSREFILKITSDEKDLSLKIAEKSNPDEIIKSTKISDFENYNESETKEKIISALKTLNIEYQETEYNERSLETLARFLTIGTGHQLFDDAIVEKMSKEEYYNSKLADIFTVIFVNLLNEKTKLHTEESIPLLEKFAFENYYRLPVFRKTVFYIISQNWETTKSIFWEMLKNKDTQKYFSDRKYDKDIYALLRKNQAAFSTIDNNLIKEIIESGPQKQINDKDPEYVDYWKLRWYSALRENDVFKENYKQLSKSLDLTHEHYENYENLGRITYRSGSIPPLSLEDLSNKSNPEIVKYIHDFNPKDIWEGPSSSGLAETLRKAVEDQPQKFVDEISLYTNIGYIYVYHLLRGLEKAWNEKKSFDWEKVLDFCKEYITSEKFYSEQLSLESDSWRASSSWVVEAIGNLLTDGMRQDTNALDLRLLPKAKEILILLVSHLKPIDDISEDIERDYPTYSLNSTAGKVLRALLDYSLIRGRNLNSKEIGVKFEEDIKKMFESVLDRTIIDIYIITGMYFEQFYFLDKDWISNIVKTFYDLEDKYWIAFISGFSAGNPPFSENLYQLFYPHYEKAIKNDLKIVPVRSLIPGLTRHLVAFYFLGFDDLEKDGLVKLFLNRSQAKSILEFVNYATNQEKYYKSLSEDELNRFERTMLKLWKFLADKFEKPNSDEEKDLLAGLSNLIVFIPKLTKEYTDLILKSCAYFEVRFFVYELYENLFNLRYKGNTRDTANYIGQILNSIPFNSYFSDEDKTYLQELVTLMYENGQNQSANEYCNKTAMRGHVFLTEIYKKYNN